MPDQILRKIARRWISNESRLSRRTMLRAGVAAVGASMLSGCATGGRAASASRPRVVVIGAGFSGLACAYELKSAGCEVTVIESRGRVGGRVVTLTDIVPGLSVEGGGEWIGTNHLNWLAYLEKFGLKFREASDDEGAIRYFLDGHILNEAETTEVEEGLEAVEKALTDQAKEINADEPWLSPRAVELDALPLSGFIARQEVGPLAKKMADLLFSADNAVPTADQSYLANLAMVKGGGLEAYWTDSEVGRCEGGNQSLATKLAEAIGADQIRLNTSVDRLVRGESNIKVILRDGSQIECDEVVCTVPPSVWDKIKFGDLLPRELKVQMGRSVKYAAPVRSRFWKEKNLNQETHSENLVSESWDSTDGQAGEAAVLACFVSAAQCDRALALNADQRDEAFKAELERLFPGYEGQLGGRPRLMNWVQDPNTLGSYSFARPGAITTVNRQLHASKTKLHFAGEHTCPKFVGYMEGALDSGVRVARQIAKKAGIV